jgi:hypothetical protein
MSAQVVASNPGDVPVGRESGSASPVAVPTDAGVVAQAASTVHSPGKHGSSGSVKSTATVAARPTSDGHGKGHGKDHGHDDGSGTPGKGKGH